ncbi:MAG TPA: LysE family transporter [Candidatus Saccharicenans sp.]|jgi:threonine/homoserine/homoserine lactone efflux protein|nr:LysE family transporter [Candidatus Saccharicenans sp.]HQO76039.1 LysE family transporter [Candidatus Saccharicenans sp.]HUM78509.1 LysE family transporter [Candidatus Saccharicenans sp.]
MFVLIGFLIGFFAAVPVGPVNIYIISQTLKRDFFHGMIAGLSTALLDLTFCLVSLIGFFHISLNLSGYTQWLKVGAAAILFFLGLKLFHDARNFKLNTGNNGPIAKSARPLLGVVLLYVSNPSLYAFWIGVAGAVTAHGLLKNGFWPAILFAFSCSLGALLWYFFLVRLVSHHQAKFQETTFKKMLFILGSFLIAFAIFTFISAFANIKLAGQVF